MNNSTVRKLKPEIIWNHFSDLNSIPRPSKKEKKIIKFIKDFGNSLNLETIVDTCGNVVIKKPATAGYENKKKVVLQSHLDMVCQKNNDVKFDFDSQGIQMTYEGDWVYALGTTLGADNGIGVAAIMSVLSSKDIEHPDIEALFTIDEETGMTGAFELSKDLLSGDILLNLDTEEDDEIDIGCAGGIDVTANALYEEKDINRNFITYSINLSGLHGGHSGMEIHKGLGNSNKLLNRFLYNFLKFNMQLVTFDGGGLRNAIPREASAIFSISSEFKNELQEQFIHLYTEIKSEYNNIESDLSVQLTQLDNVKKGLSIEDSKKFISSLQTAHNGVFRMSPDIDGLVEASNNIAKVKLENGKAEIQCLTRSSVESSKMWVTTSIKSAFELGGMKVKLSGSYPGWKPNTSSEILKLVVSIYEKEHGEKPFVQACHAGLECGIIGEKYPHMDMISFGPTIKGAHSPKEKVSISSVQKFWNFLLEILKNIPVK
jgi:dipeptidase D